MQVSYSRISTFNQCPFKWDLIYNKNLETIFNCDPANPFILGHALHAGIEKNTNEAIKEYVSNYPIIKDEHVTEIMKLEYLIPKVKAILPEGEHEYKLIDKDFKAFIDLLVPIDDDIYDIYDFKYSNNIDGYMESGQLHVYKYLFERLNPTKHIRNLYFVFIPKCALRIKRANKTNPRDETIYEFRNRCMEDLKSKEIKIVEVKFDYNKVIEFLLDTKHCIECKNYDKKPSRLCDWCEFQKYCEKGEDFMILPENKRKTKKINLSPDMWIYADSYVGKSTFVDQLDDLIFANTDGNVENITSPYVSIADEVIREGRVTKKIFAWEKFLEFVAELEKKENDFKVVALDLAEDLYEHCRLYMYDKLGIEHEQDAGFGKGWDMVRTEFCSTIKRLKNLGYRIIYISKEIKSEVNLKNGGKITNYAPNIPDKVANILTGTVTLTVRAFMDQRGRFLQLAKEENVFGGGRFNFINYKCELNMEAFINELRLAQGDVSEDKRTNTNETEEDSSEATPEASETAEEKSAEVEEKPVRRTRKRRD